MQRAFQRNWTTNRLHEEHAFVTLLSCSYPSTPVYIVGHGSIHQENSCNFLMLNITKPYPEFLSFAICTDLEQWATLTSHNRSKDDPPPPFLPIPELDLLWSSHSELGQFVNLIQSIEFRKLLPWVSVVWTPPQGTGRKGENSSDSECRVKSSFNSWENIGTFPRSDAYNEGLP